MFDSLIQLDKEWLLAINNGLKTPFLDTVCSFMRNQKNWYPLYAVLLYVSYRKWGLKSLWVLLGAIILVLVSDQVSANLIKNTVQRIRPCNDPSVSNLIHNIVGCGRGYSFVSAHATNHFAIAIFFGILFRPYYAWMIGVGMLWASLIAFSQVYVGVHYPLDVICGALLGSTLGFIFARFVQLKTQLHTYA